MRKLLPLLALLFLVSSTRAKADTVNTLILLEPGVVVEDSYV